jgi:predicted Zn-dependent protease
MLLLACAACNEVDEYLGRTSKKDVNYSFSCLDSAVGGRQMNRRLEKAGDLIRDIAVSEKSITDEMQTEYGREFHEQMVSDGSFKLVNDPVLQSRLTTVMNRLLEAREEPSKIQYEMYVLNDTVVNAFTFGGRIYITKAMLEKCRGKDALLHAIIGHEIGHSEAGHIKGTIQELILSNRVFGEANGATFFQIKQLLTASFNQKNELEADYYGINLTNALGYDVCNAVSFWKEMAGKENVYSEVEDFFRSHPFSELRADCLTQHIRSNFGKECGDLNRNNLLPQVAGR